MTEYLNVAERLCSMAARIPDNIAIAQPVFQPNGKPVRTPYGQRAYYTVTFKELDNDSSRIARAMMEAGWGPGKKIALMVKQGIDFITLVYALYKVGAVQILIDPGMGIRRMLQCLSQAEPDGFAAISAVQAVRALMPFRFPKAKLNLTVGRRLFWGGLSLSEIRKRSFDKPVLARTRPDDPAAIIFTSGSTGTAKGVLYTHRIIDAQVSEIAARYQIEPGETDLAGFPFFGLYDAAMGTTTVIPDMDPTHPANVDPEAYLEIARDWKVTQSFGSPALWRRVVDYCVQNGRHFDTLKRAISAGAPVPYTLLDPFRKCIHPEGDIYTPYGATESLPVASISASEILSDTAAQSENGAGTCVGKKFSKIEWCVLPVTDEPIENMDDVSPLPNGSIGELTVTGPQVTQRYVTSIEANKTSKIVDGDRIWHRIGDVGYLDDQDRFWYCGRKSHRVDTTERSFFTIPCESIANRHPKVFRSALVGVRHTDGTKEPVIIVEPEPGCEPENSYEAERFQLEVLEILKSFALTMPINRVLIYPHFPVDVRHNAKINREQLAIWAQNQ